MYLIKENKKFKRSVKKCFRSGKIVREKLQNIIEILAKGKKLEPKHKDHELKGEFQGIRECHIESDLLLLYQIDEDEQVLFLLSLGSHSDLFG